MNDRVNEFVPSISEMRSCGRHAGSMQLQFGRRSVSHRDPQDYNDYKARSPVGASGASAAGKWSPWRARAEKDHCDRGISDRDFGVGSVGLLIVDMMSA